MVIQKQIALLGRFAFLCFAFHFVGCATPGSPRGGHVDKDPPVIIEEESTPNPMANFDLDEIRITFDEWVKLQDPAKQIIISPPIEPKPFPKLDGKSVVFSIDRELLVDNTTYTINFGESIQDITEGNPVKNHTFVFSEGAYVDSLSINGVLIEASTGLPFEGAFMVLHENQSDTAITKLLPSYFSTSDTSGSFQINYLRADTFRGYALFEEGYGNYRYDDGDKIGFLEEPIVLTDSADIDVLLVVFIPEKPLKIFSARNLGNHVKVAMTRESPFLRIAGDTASIIYWKSELDTLHIWHNSLDTFEIGLLENNIPFDTIRLNPYVEKEAAVVLDLPREKRHPKANLMFSSNFPLAEIDKSRIRVSIGDTVDVSAFEVKRIDTDPLHLRLSSNWGEKTAYHIHFLPRAVTDAYGHTNDTLNFVFTTDEIANFGLLNLTLTGLDSAEQYVVKLMDKKKEVRSSIVSGQLMAVIPLDRLLVKEYSVKVITDRNRNGMWDTGDLETKRQPERIFIESVAGMRPGWDLDLTIILPKE